MRIVNRLFRRTTPGVRRAVARALAEHGRDLRVLGGVILVLGVMPTAKSAFESLIISQVDRELDESRGGDGFWHALGDVLSRPIEAPPNSSEGGVEGVVNSLVGLVSNDAPLGFVLGVYVVVVAVAYGAAVVGAKRRAAVRKTVMVELRREGIDRALDPREHSRTVDPTAEDEEDPQTDADPGGRQSSEIHTGSGNLAGGVGDLLAALQAVFALLTSVVAVWIGSWQIAILLIAFVLGQLLVGYLEQRQLEHQRRALDSKRNALVAKSNDIIRKRDLILAHDVGAHYARHLHERADAYGAIDEELAWREQRYRFAASVVSDVGRIGVLIGALVVVLLSDEITNVGDAYFIIAIYYRLLSPTQELVTRWASFRRSHQISRSFEEMLEDARADDAALYEPDAPPAGSVAIAFRNVGFSYPSKDGSKTILSDCSFEAAAGTTTLLLGRSAAGKTTIARLILGFLEPSHGQVWVAGQRVTFKTDLAQLHRELSYLAQEEHVIDDTVRANLFTDERDGVDARVVDVMRRVGLLPSASGARDAAGLLAKDAVRLSGGEKQRLALARVLIDDDPIVIMDEPLAGVDAFTFAAVSPEIRNLIAERKRTILMISHRLTFAGYVDNVVILENGRVVESGSRDALMRAGTKFRDLHDSAMAELTGTRRAI